MAGEWGQGNGVKEAAVEGEMAGNGGGFGQLDSPLGERRMAGEWVAGE